MSQRFLVLGSVPYYSSPMTICHSVPTALPDPADSTFCSSQVDTAGITLSSFLFPSLPKAKAALKRTSDSGSARPWSSPVTTASLACPRLPLRPVGECDRTIRHHQTPTRDRDIRVCHLQQRDLRREGRGDGDTDRQRLATTRRSRSCASSQL